jgi:predicted nucleic acid-binding protein
MKILVDSCVWLLALRRKNKDLLSEDEQRVVTVLSEAVQNGRIAIIGPVRQEVLSGIKDSARFEKLRGALGAFPDEPIATGQYEEAARLYNLCRSRGVECGSVDMLLCAVAAQRRWSVLTTDTGLKRCIGTLLVEGIFHQQSAE